MYAFTYAYMYSYVSTYIHTCVCAHNMREFLGYKRVSVYINTKTQPTHTHVHMYTHAYMYIILHFLDAKEPTHAYAAKRSHHAHAYTYISKTTCT